jgi:outer membrane protein OmpA-like peptidoglycan-associated protein
MAGVRSGHIIFGVGLVVMGYAILVIVLAEQAQRAAAMASMHSAALEPTPAAQTPIPTATTTTPPPEPSTTANGVATAIASAAPASSAPLADLDSPDLRLFKFSPGGAIMSREEVQRLMVLGKSLARKPQAKISIEGFGDMPGSDPLMVGIAKHRAKVAQMLLTKAGVTEDRVTLSFVDMGPDQRLARTIRLTTNPPLSEIDKP